MDQSIHQSSLMSRRDTADWLRELLAGGPMAVKEVREAAKDAGQPWRTVQRARSRARVVSRRSGYPATAVWQLSVAPVAPSHIPERFFRDLKPSIELKKPLENPQHAKVLVQYFADCMVSGRQPDERAIRYVMGALNRSLRSKKLDRELGLVRARRGNPGIQSARRIKRRLSPDDKVEIAQRLEAAAQRRGGLTREIEAVMREYAVSERTIEQLLARYRESGQEIPHSPIVTMLCPPREIEGFAATLDVSTMQAEARGAKGRRTRRKTTNQN